MLRADCSLRLWIATTLGALNKSEELLEAAIVDSPHLLDLESRQPGVQDQFIDRWLMR